MVRRANGWFRGPDASYGGYTLAEVEPRPRAEGVDAQGQRGLRFADGGMGDLVGSEEEVDRVRAGRRLHGLAVEIEAVERDLHVDVQVGVVAEVQG